jgi:hypothetical protein
MHRASTLYAAELENRVSVLYVEIASYVGANEDVSGRHTLLCDRVARMQIYLPTWEA